MSRDFTLKKYAELLQSLKKGGYLFLTFEQYCFGKGVQVQVGHTKGYGQGLHFLKVLL